MIQITDCRGGYRGEGSCNNVAPVTNLCLGRATTRSHSSQWSKKKFWIFTSAVVNIVVKNTIFRKAPPSVVSGYDKKSINLNKVVATFEKHIFLSQTDLTRTGIISNSYNEMFLNVWLCDFLVLLSVGISMMFGIAIKACYFKQHDQSGFKTALS
jgi:hypothetical protein